MKSSRELEFAPASDEFRAFVSHSVESAASALPITEEGAGDRFRISGRYLELLWKDDAFREQWDDVIARRLEERYTAEQATLLEQVQAKARQEGMEQGLRDAQARIEESTAELHKICQRILREKETLLHAHERAWCEAMMHLLRRFLVPRPEEFLSVLQAWLEDSLKSFPQKAKVRVYLSAEDHQRLSEVLNFRAAAASSPHEFGIDRNLGAGEIRCEFDGGGAFFSPSQELTELEAYLDGIFANEEAADAAGKIR